MTMTRVARGELYRRVFAEGTDGEIVLAELEELFYNVPTYTLDDDAPFNAIYLEGRRDVAAYIRECIAMQPIDEDTE